MSNRRIEADQLGDRLAIINRGRVVVEGPPSRVKDTFARVRVTELTTSRSDRGFVTALEAADLHDAFDGLEAAWAGLDDAQWDAMGVMMAGSRTMTEIVSHHLRNVEVHHVDLDAGYEPAHWPAAFVGTELPKRLRDLTSRADEATLLAWLLGRSGPPDLGPW